MNKDSFLRIGSTHQICQDYVHQYNDGVCLADGCSSVDNSDIGARLICHAKLAGNEQKLPDMVKDLGLDSSCLFATYLSLKQERDGVLFERWGDGSVVLGMSNGKVLLTEINFQQNMPYYLAYSLLGFDETFNQHKQNYVQSTAYIFNADLTLDCKFNTIEEKYAQRQENSYFSLDGVKWVAILSDGLSSFIDKTGSLVPIELVAKEIFSFKNYNGEFVKRRMRAAFKKFDELGWKNTDDFSIGVMVNG